MMLDFNVGNSSLSSIELLSNLLISWIGLGDTQAVILDCVLSSTVSAGFGGFRHLHFAVFLLDSLCF